LIDFTENGAMFKIYLEKSNPADNSTNLAIFNLEQIISWTTDISMCYASFVSLVTDETGDTLSSKDDIALVSNPTFKDAVSGLVSPVLKIDRS